MHEFFSGLVPRLGRAGEVCQLLHVGTAASYAERAKLEEVTRGKLAKTEHHRLDLADADTLADFYMSQTSTQTGFLQISAGPAVLHGRSLDLGQLRLLEIAGCGRHYWQDAMRANEWRLALLSASEGAARVGRTEVTPRLASIMGPGDEGDLLTEGRYATAEITMDAELASTLGWTAAHGSTAELPGRLASRLHAAIGNAFRSCETRSSAAGCAEVLLDLIGVILAVWPRSNAAPESGPPARAETVRRAAALLADPDYAREASIDRLSGDLGLSRRGLFLAFQQQLGIGPRRFNEITRLNGLRGQLFRARPSEATVTELAQDMGFSELGRLAGRYTALFGEPPSATLRRAG